MSDRDIIAELLVQVDELLEALDDCINQACSDSYSPRFGGTEELDSMALSAYADGMRLLADHGRLVIIEEHGRRVIARRPDTTEEERK